MKLDHPRNTGPMLESPRCGAKTRSGQSCRSPAVNGKKRCRMQAAPMGRARHGARKNALKHGMYTKKVMEEERQCRELVRQSRKLLSEFE